MLIKFIKQDFEHLKNKLIKYSKNPQHSFLISLLIVLYMVLPLVWTFTFTFLFFRYTIKYIKFKIKGK